MVCALLHLIWLHLAVSFLKLILAAATPMPDASMAQSAPPIFTYYQLSCHKVIPLHPFPHRSSNLLSLRFFMAIFAFFRKSIMEVDDFFSSLSLPAVTAPAIAHEYLPTMLRFLSVALLLPMFCFMYASLINQWLISECVTARVAKCLEFHIAK